MTHSLLSAILIKKPKKITEQTEIWSIKIMMDKKIKRNDDKNETIILIGIILYNPQIDRLQENITSIYRKNLKVIIIDNASENNIDINKLIKKYHNIIYIRNSSNLGIAKALNQICSIAEKKRFPFVLTLDQDSVCPENIIKEFSQYTGLEKLGILCPVIEDRNCGREESKTNCNDKVTVINRCITSGSMVSIEAWKSVNGFDEVMFIDKVDHDFCNRISMHGYKIYQINSVTLLHEVGFSNIRHFLGREVIVRNHNPTRKYYISRNTIFLARKKKGIGNITQSYIQVLKQLLLVLAFENQKFIKSLAILRGFIAGHFLKINRKWQ